MAAVAARWGDASVLIRPAVVAAWHLFNRPFEGREHGMYLDVFGLVTTGVGNLIDSPEAALRLPWRRPDGTRALPDEVVAEWRRVKSLQPGWGPQYYRARTALRLTDAAIDALVDRVLAANAVELARQFPGWATWPADAQLGALSRAWAAGASHAKWPHLRAACERRDWATAAVESALRTARNPGVVPRNAAQRVAFRNAAIVERDGLDPARLWWPRDLADDPPDTIPSPPDWSTAFQPLATALAKFARYFR